MELARQVGAFLVAASAAACRQVLLQPLALANLRTDPWAPAKRPSTMVATM